MRAGFKRFYDNEDGLFDKYLAFWTKLSQKFKGNSNVIGFDLLNEPWPSTIGANEEFDSTLASLYESIGETIRAVDSDKILFFQPSAFPGVVPKHHVSNTKFGTNPLAERNTLSSVLSQHVYCCANDPAHCTSKRNYGELSRKGLKGCKNFVQNLITTRSNDANELGVPLFISEFGACSGSKTCA